MKSTSFLARAAGLLLAVALPVVSYAEYNDVHLTTDTVITVGGINLSVSGNGADFDSITVNGSNFSLTMSGGSFLRVVSTDRRVLTVGNQGPLVVSYTCSATQSEYTFQVPSSSFAASPTITVESSTCDTLVEIGRAHV